MNIRIFEYFLSLNEYSLFEYVFVHIHLFNILYKFMVGTSKCPKFKQNPGGVREAKKWVPFLGEIPNR